MRRRDFEIDPSGKIRFRQYPDLDVEQLGEDFAVIRNAEMLLDGDTFRLPTAARHLPFAGLILVFSAGPERPEPEATDISIAAFFAFASITPGDPSHSACPLDWLLDRDRMRRWAEWDASRRAALEPK